MGRRACRRAAARRRFFDRRPGPRHREAGPGPSGQHDPHDTQKFDLIVDDGSHLVHHMMTTFNCLFKYVRPGGIYIIEDIKKNELHIFQEMKLEDGDVIMSHPGNSDWDAFLAIRKNKD